MSKETPAVFTIADCERHGRHFPLHPDSILLEEIVGRTERRSADNVLFPPLQRFGNSPQHHLDCSGAISAEPRLYLDLLLHERECFLPMTSVV